MQLNTMNNENHTTFHDHEFALIGDFFKNLERQGPCCPKQTLKALGFCGELPENARIADIGCGTGGQTINLAWNTDGHITAIDLMPAFTENLRQKIAGTKLHRRITVLDGSMDDLPFAANSLDLIWSEGAISHMGFEEGLRYWRQFLKPSGYVAVTEATWFTPSRPAEIAEFWKENYPGIDTIPAKVAAMERAGYFPVAHFAMPEYCWQNYYRPMEDIFEPFLLKHDYNGPSQDLVDNIKREVSLYQTYKEFYGYTFYIGRKA